MKLRAIEMDFSEQASVEAAVQTIISTEGRLDVIVHNAGHMVLGPLESFTTDQLMSVYDTNVLSTQRLNRAALPHLRNQRDGLVALGRFNKTTRGGTPPYLAPPSAPPRPTAPNPRLVGDFQWRGLVTGTGSSSDAAAYNPFEQPRSEHNVHHFGRRPCPSPVSVAARKPTIPS